MTAHFDHRMRIGGLRILDIGFSADHIERDAGIVLRFFQGETALFPSCISMEGRLQ